MPPVPLPFETSKAHAASMYRISSVESDATINLQWLVIIGFLIGIGKSQFSTITMSYPASYNPYVDTPTVLLSFVLSAETITSLFLMYGGDGIRWITGPFPSESRHSLLRRHRRHQRDMTTATALRPGSVRPIAIPQQPSPQPPSLRLNRHQRIINPMSLHRVATLQPLRFNRAAWNNPILA